ncbi:MAG: hypothetical protein KUG52_04180, partial [Immundisolibacteraceae bacterium]|nr:hypothetical protein [Immundisolibacteraceae bacterium]
YLSPDSARPKSVIFRVSAARCLSVASSRKPEKSPPLGDESAIGVSFSLVRFFWASKRNEQSLSMNSELKGDYPLC